MGLFDSAVVAAAFKTTAEPEDNTGEWTVVKPANPYGTKREKNELAITALPGDFQIYRFTIPIKQNGDYKDFPEFDEIQAITTLMELIGDIRETHLVGKQEWMQQWDSNHERLALGEIESPYPANVRTNYFQNVVEKTKYGEKDHWRMAIAGVPEKEVEGYIAEVKSKLRASKLSVYFDLHEFTEIIEYDAGWLSGMDADVLQKTAVTECIRFAFQGFDDKFLKFAPGEEGADNLPKFVLKTKRYTAVKNGATRASAPVVTVACEQKNISRLRRLLQVLHDRYLMMGFNEFVSTKCNSDQRWECLNHHINFLADKLYFYVVGAGLDDAHNNMILDESVTHDGKQCSLRELLASKGLYSFIQQARYGGTSKLICQHTASFETKVGTNNVSIAPRSWFVDEIIMADGNNWTARQFSPKHNHTLGVSIKNSKQQPTRFTSYKANTIPVNIWKQKAAERASAQPKTPEATGATGAPGAEEESQGDASFASIQSQLTEELEKNRVLLDDNQKLSEANKALNEKLTKLESDNTIQNVRLNAQAGRISKHDDDMREMQHSQRESQRNIARLMEQLNCQQDNDEQMKLESKRADTETPELVHTPEATHNARSKTQRTQESLSKPTTLFTNQKSLSPSRTLAVIAETGAGILHRTPPQHLNASTSYAKGTSGGSKK
jgi:hypothetical protein